MDVQTIRPVEYTGWTLPEGSTVRIDAAQVFLVGPDPRNNHIPAQVMEVTEDLSLSDGLPWWRVGLPLDAIPEIKLYRIMIHDPDRGMVKCCDDTFERDAALRLVRNFRLMERVLGRHRPVIMEAL